MSTGHPLLSLFPADFLRTAAIATLALLAVQGCAVPRTGSYPGTPSPDDGISFERLGALLEAQQLLDEKYLGDPGINLIDEALRAELSVNDSLDPYSEFMDAGDFRRSLEASQGRFGGVGLVLRKTARGLCVIRVIPDGPADKAGIQADEVIVSVDHQPVSGLSLKGAVTLLRGTPGTNVSLAVADAGEPAVRTVILRREIVSVPTVSRGIVLADSVGILRISQIRPDTPDQLRRATARVLERGATALILDLRGNPGGSLQAAVAVCGLFLPARTTVVRTVGRTRDECRTLRTAWWGKRWKKLPLALLVDDRTASAAEIVAACLQNWKRAIVVGTTTLGKGTVQELVRLPDGTGIRLTTAVYLTPSGESVQDVGVTPDIPIAYRLDDIVRPRAQPWVPHPPHPDTGDIDRTLEAALRALRTSR
jgi:carboxyl-terminal processing protease